MHPRDEVCGAGQLVESQRILTSPENDTHPRARPSRGLSGVCDGQSCWPMVWSGCLERLDQEYMASAT
ncbi:Uncharacterised protein [Cutibacterium granulosum]|uniref:Uncharacterized protein n=1 Tax=Cutibacterium granulosum TaxID=33011 RepID=A0A239W118_9ACTN|nr:Uncharacterised protein [Cutibacterium granulosum]